MTKNKIQTLIPAFLFIYILLFLGYISIAQTGKTLQGDTTKTATNKNIHPTRIDTGYATFYGNLWHGRRTASGLPYHKDSLTCAHLKYPFGTILKVTNLKNNKTTIVKVTDRGPHVRTRIIDLSMAAAKQLAMVADGVTKVAVEKIK